VDRVLAEAAAVTDDVTGKLISASFRLLPTFITVTPAAKRHKTTVSTV